MPNISILSVPKDRRLAMTTFLDILWGKFDNPLLKNKRETIVKKQINYLGMTYSEHSEYLHNVDPVDFEMALLLLNIEEKELFISLVIELLDCSDTPNVKDFGIASILLEDIAGIDEQELTAYLNMLYSSKNLQSNSGNKTINQGHADESTVGGIILTVLMILAIVGLVSLCSNK